MYKHNHYKYQTKQNYFNHYLSAALSALLIRAVSDAPKADVETYLDRLHFEQVACLSFGVAWSVMSLHTGHQIAPIFADSAA